MEKQIVTVADLVGAIIAEMERRNYKPSVIKQYRIVWTSCVGTQAQCLWVPSVSSTAWSS